MNTPGGASDGRVNRDWQKHWKKGEWNTLRARITGEVPQIQVWLNDAPLVDWKDTKNHAAGGATDGMIAVQLHFSNDADPPLEAGRLPPLPQHRRQGAVAGSRRRRVGARPASTERPGTGLAGHSPSCRAPAVRGAASRDDRRAVPDRETRVGGPAST